MNVKKLQFYTPLTFQEYNEIGYDELDTIVEEDVDIEITLVGDERLEKPSEEMEEEPDILQITAEDVMVDLKRIEKNFHTILIST